MNIPADAISRKARGLAVQYHDKMYGKHPYYYHLDAVCQKLSDLNHGDELTLTVGYLHDILEDTKCPPKTIVELFGQEVFEAVTLLTKGVGQSFGKARYFDYIDSVKSNKIARIVKIADTICNLEECLRNKDTRAFKYSQQLNLLVE